MGNDETPVNGEWLELPEGRWLRIPTEWAEARLATEIMFTPHPDGFEVWLVRPDATAAEVAGAKDAERSELVARLYMPKENFRIWLETMPQVHRHFFGD